MKTGAKVGWGCLVVVAAAVAVVLLPAFEKARWSVVVAPIVENERAGAVEVVGIASGGRVRKGTVGPGESRRVRLFAGDAPEPITIVVTSPAGRANNRFVWSRVVPMEETDLGSITVHADGSVEVKRRPR